MLGINAQTGQPLSGIDHLRQSIRDILTTRIGTRVMRRDYGSRLHALVDNPMTPRLAMDLYSATAEALARWEPRFKLTRGLCHRYLSICAPASRPTGASSASSTAWAPRATRRRSSASA